MHKKSMLYFFLSNSVYKSFVHYSSQHTDSLPRLSQNLYAVGVENRHLLIYAPLREFNILAASKTRAGELRRKPSPAVCKIEKDNRTGKWKK